MTIEGYARRSNVWINRRDCGAWFEYDVWDGTTLVATLSSKRRAESFAAHARKTGKYS